jgi:subtilase family serine protease
LRDAYKLTDEGSPSTIIAIVDAFAYDNAEPDLGVYRAQWGLDACTTDNGCFKKLNQKGQQKDYPVFNLGWAQESALDLDMASAACPKCTIYLVEARDNSFKNLGEAVVEAASLGAHVISNSYGGGEIPRVKKLLPFYDHPGIAVTASTGDSGYGIQSPADMPSVIAVGGTALRADGSARGWTEAVWAGAGSGCSTVFKMPMWQRKLVKNHSELQGCLKTGPGGIAGRMAADVSAVASPGTPVAVYGPTSETTSNWLAFGGTSVSAPLVGGIIAANGGAVDAAHTIYQHSHALFDVTTGTNGSCDPYPAFLCNGEVGYDGPTGLGTPNGNKAFGN